MPDARIAIHAALTAIMAWLGLVLMLPGDTFSGSISYAVMASLGTETEWAISFWLIALVGAFGLTTPHSFLRLMSILIVAAAHGTFALCLVLANPVNTGTGTYSIVALLGYYLALRRTRENA